MTVRPRRERPARPVARGPPKAKRLKPGRAHRNEVLDALSPSRSSIAEQVLRGGIPAVRQAVEKQNEEARAAGTPEIKAEGMVTLAEQLLPACAPRSGTTGPTPPWPTSTRSTCATSAPSWSRPMPPLATT